jgi:hypothetical protein
VRVLSLTAPIAVFGDVYLGQLHKMFTEADLGRLSQEQVVKQNLDKRAQTKQLTAAELVRTRSITADPGLSSALHVFVCTVNLSVAESLCTGPRIASGSMRDYRTHKPLRALISGWNQTHARRRRL